MNTASHPPRYTAVGNDQIASGSTAPHTGLAAATYDELKHRLLAGELPLGHRLAEGRLAEELGVSRTPVREALVRLLAEGLVERRPQGGYGPVAPDLLLIRELYEVRFALELDALKRPARLGTKHDPVALRSLRNDWMDLRDAVGDDQGSPDVAWLDEDFHLRLAAAAGNDALCELLARVNERIRPVRVHDFRTGERIERTISQHLAVLDAVIEGDDHAARSLLEAHFDESFSVVEERATAALVAMATRRRGSVR